jgi:hypothetical protein
MITPPRTGKTDRLSGRTLSLIDTTSAGRKRFISVDA